MTIVVLILLALAAALYVLGLLKARIELIAVAGLVGVVAAALPLLTVLG